MNNTEFVPLFLRVTLHRMKDLYAPKLKLALAPLTKEVLWSKPGNSGNSIGGIVLHICEHIHRNQLRLTGREEELAAGFERYFPDEDLSATQLLELAERQLRDWEAVMHLYLSGESVFTAEQLHQLYHLVEHTGYHLGQVLDRIQSGTGTTFDFVQKGLNERFLRERVEANENNLERTER